MTYSKKYDDAIRYALHLQEHYEKRIARAKSPRSALRAAEHWEREAERFLQRARRLRQAIADDQTVSGTSLLFRRWNECKHFLMLARRWARRGAKPEVQDIWLAAKHLSRREVPQIYLLEGETDNGSDADS